MNLEEFEQFNVYSLDNKYSFFHIKLEDNEKFYANMFDYFFDENKLLCYIENESFVKFNPKLENFATMYKFLEQYIDDYNEEMTIVELDEEIRKILCEEYQIVSKKEKDKLTVRLDKIGKIGEYIFYCILKDYFKFDCIIPKIHLATNKNMSVYGIDSLFYSSCNNLLLFGESKFTETLENGVSLIRESLKKYEKMIKDEYTIILSNRNHTLKKFREIYGEVSDISLNMEDFIEKAGIKKIGIPIFIAHGKDLEIKDIINKLKKIEEKKFLGIETIYYFISLPIINKSKCISIFTKKIKERRLNYENECRK